jgi:RNA polymerase sigma factor (sigma-70 family)
VVASPPIMIDDHILIEAWRNGDNASAEVLIERYYDSIARFFASKAGNEADDLVQRTFLRCAEGIGRYRGDANFRAYLFGIARNVLYEHIRRRVRDGPVEPDFGASSLMDLAPGVSTIAAQRAEQRVLVMALQRIPLELQIVLELYYWEGLGVAELAEVLAIPAGTVKSRLHRARSLLRDAMERLPATPEEQRTVRALLQEWAADVRGLAGGD